MRNPFARRPLLDGADTAFQIECHEWLLAHFGGPDFFERARLVLPTDEFFPAAVDSPRACAEATFERVKRYVGLENWAVTLEAQPEGVDPRVSPSLFVQGVEAEPGGAFSIGEGHGATITYDPAIVADPVAMVAVFAHELSHYLTHAAPEPPPGGWENWEFATDACATFLGFGTFQANAAFGTRQSADGFSARRLGYLTQAEHGYALALFLRLRGIAPGEAAAHCCRNVRGYLKRALAEIDRDGVAEALAKVAFRGASSTPAVRTRA